MSGPGKYKGLIYLTGLVIVIPWLAWRMAIAGNVEMSTQAGRFEKQTAALRAKAAQAETAPAAAVLTAGVLQSGVPIPVIMGSEAGSRCKVVRYTPYITESRDGLAVHTAELVVSGAYADLLRLVAAAEGNGEGYRLVSAAFRSIRQRHKKETQLQLTMILQQITRTI